jgi:hypothetical protein
VPGFDDAAAILALKQRENPFLEYVAHGSTDRMLAQILAKCPAPENDPPHARFQWAWERADDEQPFSLDLFTILDQLPNRSDNRVDRRGLPYTSMEGPGTKEAISGFGQRRIWEDCVMYKLISIILAAIPFILFLRTIFIGRLRRSQAVSDFRRRRSNRQCTGTV